MKQLLLAAFAAIFFALPLQAISAQQDLARILYDTGGKTHGWTIELADTGESRATGLMNRKSLAPGTGMLFRFDETREVFMWMKNTYISLDMVFMDEAGRIVHIAKATTPLSTAIIGSQQPARFVLEINAGEADGAGLSLGAVMKHPWFSTE